MQTLKSLRDWMVTIIEDESQDTEFDLLINTAIEECAKMRHFGVLKDSITLTTDTNGDIWLPAYMRAIAKVTKGDGSYPNNETGFAKYDTTPDRFELRIKEPYYIYQGLSRVAQTSPTCDVTQGSSSIDIRVAAATWFAASDVNKAVSFAGDDTVYELTAVDTVAETATIFPAYRNATETTSGIVATTPVEGEKVMRCYNEDDTVYQSLPVTIEYQRYHPKLYHDDERCYLPCEKVLRLLILQAALVNGKYDTDARNLANELELAKHAELGPEMTEKKRRMLQPRGKGPSLFRRGVSRRASGK